MKIVRLYDRNHFSFETSEEVGYSIITLVEETKCRKLHERNIAYKRFSLLWDKPNWHIYIPCELKKYEKEFIDSKKESNIVLQCRAIEKMCVFMFTLMCEYFFQTICMIVIVFVHVENDLIISNGFVYPRNQMEEEIAIYLNNVSHKSNDYHIHKDSYFNGAYLTLSSNKCNEKGNLLVNELLKNYYVVKGNNNFSDIVLCGKGKSFGNLLNEKHRTITEQKILQIYNSYCTYRVNDDLTKRLFIPYLLNVFTKDESIFEFNHIADSFLIFNSITAAKSEGCLIEIVSDDKTLKDIQKQMEL